MYYARVVLWNDVEAGPLQPLMGDHGGALPIIVAIETANPVDSEAVMVLLERTPMFAQVGGTPVALGDMRSTTGPGYVRLGYVSRGDMADKRQVFRRLQELPNGSTDARLSMDAEGRYWLELAAEDWEKDLSKDVPF